MDSSAPSQTPDPAGSSQEPIQRPPISNSPATGSESGSVGPQSRKNQTKRSYISATPQFFDFLANAFDNGPLSRIKRRKASIKEPLMTEPMVVYDKGVFEYQGLKKATHIKKAEFSRYSRRLRMANAVYLEFHYDTTPLLELVGSSMISFLKRAEIEFEMTYHIAKFTTEELTIVSKRLAPIKVLKKLLLPDMRTLDLEKRNLNPVFLWCPRIKVINLHPQYRGKGSFSKANFPNLETLILGLCVLDSVHLDFPFLKVFSMAGGCVKHFQVSHCPRLESINCSRTNIQAFESFAFLPNLKTIRIDGCSQLERLTFGYCPHLISVNALGCRNLALFGSLIAPKLQSLDLSQSGEAHLLELLHLQVPELKLLFILRSGVASLPHTPQLVVLLAQRALQLTLLEADLSSVRVADLLESALRTVLISISRKMGLLNLAGNSGLVKLKVECEPIDLEELKILNRMSKMLSGGDYFEERAMIVIREGDFNLLRPKLEFISDFDTYLKVLEVCLQCDVDMHATGLSDVVPRRLELTPFHISCPDLISVERLELPKVHSVRIEAPKLASIGTLKCVLASELEILGGLFSDIGGCNTPLVDHLVIKNIPMTSLSSFSVEHVQELELCGVPLTTVDSRMTNLRNIRLSGLPQLEDLPIDQAENLELIRIDNCPKLEFLLGLVQCSSLYIENCSGLNLLSLDAYGLEKLEIINCNSLKQISKSFVAPSLKSLSLKSCLNLSLVDFLQSEDIILWESENLPNLENWTLGMSPETARIIGLNRLEKLPECLDNVKALEIESCDRFALLDVLKECQEVTVRKCASFTGEGIEGPHIQHLLVEECPSFKGLFDHYPAVTQLAIRQCGALQVLDLNTPKLESIKVERCPSLISINPQKRVLEKLSDVFVSESPVTSTFFPHTRLMIRKLNLEKLALTDLSCLRGTRIGLIRVFCDNLESIESLDVANSLELTVSLKELTNFKLSGTTLQRVLVKSCPKLRLVSLLKNRMKKLKSVEVLRCNLDRLEVGGDIEVTLHKVILSESVFLSGRPRICASGCVFTGSLTEIADRITSEHANITSLSVYSEMVVSQIKSIVNCNLGSQVFSGRFFGLSNGEDKSNMIFLPDGYLGVPAGATKVESDVIFSLRNDSLSQDLQNIEKTLFIQDRGDDHKYFRDDQELGSALKLFSVFSKARSSHEPPVARKTLCNAFILLYLLFNIPEANEKVSRYIFQPGVSANWKEAERAMRGPWESEEYFKNLRTVVMNQVAHENTRSLREKLMERYPEVGLDDLVPVDFGLSIKALEFLSQNPEKYESPSCAICLDEDPEKKLLYCFYRKCGHFACSMCIKELFNYSKQCFSCRGDVLNGTLSQEKVLPEVKLFVKLQRDPWAWNECGEALKKKKSSLGLSY